MSWCVLATTWYMIGQKLHGCQTVFNHLSRHFGTLGDRKQALNTSLWNEKHPSDHHSLSELCTNMMSPTAVLIRTQVFVSIISGELDTHSQWKWEIARVKNYVRNLNDKWITLDCHVFIWLVSEILTSNSHTLNIFTYVIGPFSMQTWFSRSKDHNYDVT